ncbi:MAG: flagellar biosynthetic protein FliO [Bacillota bacterium]|nr:flagellar biosynthetic protein FliO [Bacillota bacterium]
MSWLVWLRVVAVTAVLIPFVQISTRFWAERAQSGGRHLRVLETCSLGSDGRLHLVEVAGKVYALACGAKGIQVIGEVAAPEVLSELSRGEGVRTEVLPLAGQVTGWLAAGRALLRRLGGGRGDADLRGGNEARRRTVEALEGQLARLRRLSSAGDEAFAVGKR